MTEATESRGSAARRSPALAGLVGFAAGVVVALIAVALWPESEADTQVDFGRVDLAGADPDSAVTTSSVVDPVAAGEAVRVLVVGDSISAQIGWSLELWSQDNPDVVTVFNEAHLGCGVVRYGQKRVADGNFGPVGDVCSDWAVEVPLQTVAESEVVSWPTALELFEPEIVVAVVSSWDAVDRIVPGLADEWTALGDPVFDDYVRGEYAEATEVLTATGAHLHWLVSPYLNAPILHDDHRERVDRLNELVVEAVASLPDRSVTLLDYPGFIGAAGSERDVAIRDDGVHLSDQGFDEVAPWLVEAIDL